MSESPSVTLGHRHEDWVTISVFGRMHQSANDFWDGNWLLSPVEFKLGGFSGIIGASLRVDELVRFRQQLEKAYQEFGGIARLNSMEDWVDLTVEVSPSGRVEIKGKLRDQPGTGNTLSFNFTGLDQTNLPEIIGSLSEIETAYPIRGKP